jgi:hypothetical protein
MEKEKKNHKMNSEIGKPKTKDQLCVGKLHRALLASLVYVPFAGEDLSYTLPKRKGTIERRRRRQKTDPDLTRTPQCPTAPLTTSRCKKWITALIHADGNREQEMTRKKREEKQPKIEKGPWAEAECYNM